MPLDRALQILIDQANQLHAQAEHYLKKRFHGGTNALNRNSNIYENQYAMISSFNINGVIIIRIIAFDTLEVKHEPAARTTYICGNKSEVLAHFLFSPIKISEDPELLVFFGSGGPKKARHKEISLSRPGFLIVDQAPERGKISAIVQRVIGRDIFQDLRVFNTHPDVVNALRIFVGQYISQQESDLDTLLKKLNLSQEAGT